jgi:LPXTG-motif cell wall-anchored protein
VYFFVSTALIDSLDHFAKLKAKEEDMSDVENDPLLNERSKSMATSEWYQQNKTIVWIVAALVIGGGGFLLYKKHRKNKKTQ